jgi:hypothetical protein
MLPTSGFAPQDALPPIVFGATLTDRVGNAYECDVAEIVVDRPAVSEALLSGTFTRRSKIERVDAADDLVDRLILVVLCELDQRPVKTGDFLTRPSSATGAPHSRRDQPPQLERRAIPLQLRGESNSLEVSALNAPRIPANRSNQSMVSPSCLPRRRGNEDRWAVRACLFQQNGRSRP